MLKTVIIALSILAAPLAARAQDIVKISPAHCKVKLDNAHVRVVECVLLPGEKDAQHTHPAGYYYVTQAGKMKVVYASGKTEMWEPQVGEASWIDGDPPHTSENVGKTPLAYTLVEVKSAARK